MTLRAGQAVDALVRRSDLAGFSTKTYEPATVLAVNGPDALVQFQQTIRLIEDNHLGGDEAHLTRWAWVRRSACVIV